MQNNFNNGGLFLNKEKQPFFDERLAFFSALCLFLSAFEFTIPKPLPFFRLGLANLPLILALEKFKLKDYIALSFMKVFLQGFLAGTFFSYIFLFSFAGTFFSSLVIYIAFLVFRRKGFISFFTLSILGAFASNCAQLLCAKFILFGSSVKYIAPLLLFFGLISGSLLGLFANAFIQKSNWYKHSSEKLVEKVWKNQVNEKKSKLVIFDKVFIVFCFCCLILLFFQKKAIFIWILTFLFLIIDEIRLRGRIKVLPSFFLCLFIIFFELLVSRGKVLLTIGSFKVTDGSLNIALIRCGKLVGMLFISQSFLFKNMKLPGSFGLFLSKVFFYFSSLSDWKKFKRDKGEKFFIIEKLDKILLECESYEY